MFCCGFVFWVGCFVVLFWVGLGLVWFGVDCFVLGLLGLGMWICWCLLFLYAVGVLVVVYTMLFVLDYYLLWFCGLLFVWVCYWLVDWL